MSPGSAEVLDRLKVGLESEEGEVFEFLDGERLRVDAAEDESGDQIVAGRRCQRWSSLSSAGARREKTMSCSGTGSHSLPPQPWQPRANGSSCHRIQDEHPVEVEPVS